MIRSRAVDCEWVDITLLCSNSVSELSKCKEIPMVSIPNFSLHESMAAVEVSLFSLSLSLLKQLTQSSYLKPS
jgi:hypothetical protein